MINQHTRHMRSKHLRFNYALASDGEILLSDCRMNEYGGRLESIESMVLKIDDLHANNFAAKKAGVGIEGSHAKFHQQHLFSSGTRARSLEVAPIVSIWWGLNHISVHVASNSLTLSRLSWQTVLKSTMA